MICPFPCFASPVVWCISRNIYDNPIEDAWLFLKMENCTNCQNYKLEWVVMWTVHVATIACWWAFCESCNFTVFWRFWIHHNIYSIKNRFKWPKCLHVNWIYELVWAQHCFMTSYIWVVIMASCKGIFWTVMQCKGRLDFLKDIFSPVLMQLLKILPIYTVISPVHYCLTLNCNIAYY